MRRHIIGLIALVLAGTAGYGVFAGVQRIKACAPTAESIGASRQPDDPPAEAAPGAIAGNVDSAMSGVCRFACATKLKYDPADVIAQPGAQPGKLAQCPVSGVVFVVDASRPSVRVAGNDYVTCCGTCGDRLQHAPLHYLKA
jgi:hypothetical protein